MTLDSPLARRLADLGFSPHAALALLALLAALVPVELGSHGAGGTAAYVGGLAAAALAVAVVPLTAALADVRLEPVLAGAACASAAAAAIHFAVIGEHVDE